MRRAGPRAIRDWCSETGAPIPLQHLSWQPAAFGWHLFRAPLWATSCSSLLPSLRFILILGQRTEPRNLPHNGLDLTGRRRAKRVACPVQARC